MFYFLFCFYPAASLYSDFPEGVVFHQRNCHLLSLVTEKGILPDAGIEKAVENKERSES